MTRSCPTPMPEIAMLLAIPIRCGYQRLSSTPMGVTEVPALPSANTTP